MNTREVMKRAGSMVEFILVLRPPQGRVTGFHNGIRTDRPHTKILDTGVVSTH